MKNRSNSEVEKVLALEAFKEDQYEDMDLDRLTLVTIKTLLDREIEPTYDNIIVANFKLFPKKFSLPSFPMYPDGKRAHDSLWHVSYKTKKWISGNPKSGYAFTEKGLYELEEAYNRLGRPDLWTGQGKVKRKESYFIDTITRNSLVFSKWSQGKENEIKKWEVLELLSATSMDTAKKNLESRLKYASSLEDKEALKFYQFIQEFLVRKV